MSIDLNSLKANVNTAVNLSTEGKQTEAFEVINNAYPHLNSAQNDVIITLLSAASLKEPAKCMAEKVKMLTLISSSPRPTSEPVKVIKKRISPSKLVSSRINFIGRNFVDNTLTDKHFSRDAIINKTIKQTKVKVLCYHEESDLISDFNFNDNGFKFIKFDGKLLQLAEEFSHRKNDNGCAESLLMREATNFMTNWEKENNIEFDVVAPLGLVYRNQDESDKNAQRPIPFAHVDFQEKTIKKTFRDLVKVWKPPMETVLGEMSTEKYNNLKVVKMCNLWMSLNILPARNTLAVLDKTSIGVSQLRPYLGETQDPLVKVTSMSLHEDKNQRWVAHDQMTIGKGIIFNTLLTPHTAIKLPKILMLNTTNVEKVQRSDLHLSAQNINDKRLCGRGKPRSIREGSHFRYKCQIITSLQYFNCFSLLLSLTIKDLALNITEMNYFFSNLLAINYILLPKSILKILN